MLKGLVLGFFLVLLSVGRAQSNCDGLLHLGIPNIDIVEVDESKRTEIIRQLKQYRSYEEAKQSSFGFGLDVLLGALGLTKDDSGFKRLVEQLEQYERQTSDFKFKFRQYTQRASEEIARIFLECVSRIMHSAGEPSAT